jgi:hypothetical protein
VVLVMMVGSPEPPLYLTLLSYIGHHGPSNDGRESEKSGSPLCISCCCPIKDMVVLVLMLGSHGPSPHLTFLSDKGHRGS